MALRKLKCTHCGAQLQAAPGASTVTCEYCRSQFQVPSAPATEASRNLPTATRYLPVGFALLFFVLPGVLALFGVGAAVMVALVGGEGEGMAAESAVTLPPGLAEARSKAEGLAARARGGTGLAGKLHRYVDLCVNRHSRRAFDSRRRYLSWVDREEGPSAQARHVHGLYTLYETEDCAQAVGEAATMDPKRPALEKAAIGYVSALEELHRLTGEAAVYYDRANYEDDDFARGQELHEPLLAAFERFAGAHRALATAVDEAHAGYAAERRKALEKSGDGLGLLVLESKLAAKELGEQANVPWDRLDTVDAERFTARAEGYERMVDELGSQLDASPPDDPFSDLPRYHRESGDLAKAAKEMARRLDDEGGFDRRERSMLSRSTSSHHMIDGAPGKVIDRYNEVAAASPAPELRVLIPVAEQLAE